MFLGTLYGVVLTVLFTKGSQLLSTKLSQVCTEAYKNIENEKDSKSVSKQKKFRQRMSFDKKSTFSISKESQRTDAAIKGSSECPSSVIESVNTNCAVAPQKGETRSGKRSNAIICWKLSRKIESNNVNVECQIVRHPKGESCYVKNFRQIQRIRKCSKLLSVLHLLFAIGSAVLAAIISNPKLGAVPHIFLCFTIVCAVLIRMVIVEYLYGSSQFSTRFLSRF